MAHTHQQFPIGVGDHPPVRHAVVWRPSRRSPYCSALYTQHRRGLQGPGPPTRCQRALRRPRALEGDVLLGPARVLCALLFARSLARPFISAQRFLTPGPPLASTSQFLWPPPSPSAIPSIHAPQLIPLSSRPSVWARLREGFGTGRTLLASAGAETSLSKMTERGHASGVSVGGSHGRGVSAPGGETHTAVFGGRKGIIGRGRQHRAGARLGKGPNRRFGVPPTSPTSHLRPLLLPLPRPVAGRDHRPTLWPSADGSGSRTRGLDIGPGMRSKIGALVPPTRFPLVICGVPFVVTLYYSCHPAARPQPSRCASRWTPTTESGRHGIDCNCAAEDC
jgi:hypothetical protein